VPILRADAVTGRLQLCKYGSMAVSMWFAMAGAADIASSPNTIPKAA